MIYTAIGGLTATLNQYFNIQASAGLPSYAGPPAAGDGHSVSLPVAGSFSNARIDLATAAPAAGWTFTLFQNTTATSITMTVASGLKTASYTGGLVHFAAGDFATWKYTGAVTGCVSNFSLTVEFTPDS